MWLGGCGFGLTTLKELALGLRDIYNKLGTHICFRREQLQMLHVGQNSCKCFSYKSKIGGRALQKGYLHQATNSQSEQLVALGENSCKCFTRASAMRARQPAVLWSTVYSASACMQYGAVQFPLFLNKRTENQFLKMNGT